MTDKAATLPDFKALRRARFEREKRQTELIPVHELHKASVAAKLIGIATGTQVNNFQRCGVEEMYVTCKDCGTSETFYYNCNRKWCPRCAPRLARIRAEKLKVWSTWILQPKHLVLTMRNFPVLTRAVIRRFQKALLRLRKQTCWSEVLGGCCTLEITNEGRGWHLHAHILIDCRWMDMEALSVSWGKLIGQEFGIVKIKDVRGSDYLAEVSKYVVKGSELAKWSGDQLWEFISAIRGCRFFFAFGSLFKMGSEIRAAIAMLTPDRKTCECGCQEFKVQSEADAVLEQIRKDGRFGKKR